MVIESSGQIITQLDADKPTAGRALGPVAGGYVFDHARALPPGSPATGSDRNAFTFVDQTGTTQDLFADDYAVARVIDVGPQSAVLVIDVEAVRSMNADQALVIDPTSGGRWAVTPPQPGLVLGGNLWFTDSDRQVLALWWNPAADPAVSAWLHTFRDGGVDARLVNEWPSDDETPVRPWMTRAAFHDGNLVYASIVTNEITHQQLDLQG